MPQAWEKVWEREYNLNKMDLALRGLNSSYAKRFMGTSFPNVLAIQMPNRNDAFCFSGQSYARWMRLMLDVFDSAPRFLKFFSAYQSLKREFIRTARQAGADARNTRDRAALKRLFEGFSAVDTQYVLIGQWMGFHVTDSAEARARELVQSRIPDPDARATCLGIILAPEYMSEIRKERRSLLRVALAPARQREALLARHAQQYEWIPCINVIEPAPWTFAHFKRELSAILKSGTARDELNEGARACARTKRAYKKIRQAFPARDRALLDRMHRMAFIKDDRDDVRRKAYYYATPLYERIAQALGHAPKEILLYTAQEILQALKSGTALSAQEFAKRRREYALVLANGRTVVHTGKEYRRYLLQITKHSKTGNMVSGVAASTGAARGIARIVPNAYSLDKIKKGDVLITVATHPDYLPAMRLASAFVTDEGGLTCHAAIVAREMGKPAVVGTKNATEVFKDGDRVEVDAEKGIVKKL